jgi:glycosyltransferase involved in cell wall biosynthesis
VLPELGELGPALRAAGVEVLVRPVSVLRRQLLTPLGLASIARDTARNAAQLRALISERKLSLVHSNTSVVLGGAAAAALARVPHVWHVREIYSRFGRAWPAYRTLLGRAAALPCVSAAAAVQFESAGRARTRVRVIHDGLAVDPRRAPSSEARAALGLPADAPVVAVLGRISDWKGQDVLVRALAEPPLASVGAIGVIAGDAWPGTEERRGAVVELARSSGVSDRLRLVGFRDDIENVYGAADVVAVPSTQPDPLPNSALEAAAAGCAVVASAHGGLPEIIRDGVTGKLVAPGDAGALARAAAELIAEPALSERLGAAAAADVRDRFAPERLLDAIQALYDEQLAPSS